jgi:alpha-beta hydrolase superfamily lysophospholipase
MAKRSDKSIPLWGKGLLAALALFLAGALYFAYGVLPARVAASIVEKAAVRKPLTRSPTEVGLRYQEVSFASADGVPLSGWLIETPKGKGPLGMVVLSHGVFKNREQVLDRAELLAKSGYGVLMFDHRGCGLSGESPVSGGVLEAADYRGAVDFLRSRDGKGPLVLFGFSMGGMSALRAVFQGVRADGVIADSPLANLDCYVSRRTSGGALTALPGFLSRCLSEYARRTGLALTRADLDLVRVAQGLPDVPVLYLTGEGDDLARPEEVRRLFENTKAKRKRLVYIPEAGHEEGFEKAPILYRRSVIGFLTDIREGFPTSVNGSKTQ